MRSKYFWENSSIVNLAINYIIFIYKPTYQPYLHMRQAQETEH